MVLMKIACRRQASKLHVHIVHIFIIHLKYFSPKQSSTCFRCSHTDKGPRLTTLNGPFGHTPKLQSNTFCKFENLAGDIYIPVSVQSWVAECIGSRHVLWIMWMAHPNQASRPQGYHHVNGDTLAANDSGIGSGWQQGTQNWARLSVVGHWARMKCSDLCCVQNVH